MTTNKAYNNSLSSVAQHLRLSRGMLFGVIIITALLAFEVFNYGTTDYALSDLIGDLEFMGLRWATILSIAFCGIDFAGIARLFAPEAGRKEHTEVWYLFGAWLLAATMNAMLTWWGVSLAVLNHETLGNEVVARGTLLRVVPIFVAILVWLIRVLIIGTFSVAGDQLFALADERTTTSTQAAIQKPRPPIARPAATPTRALSQPSARPMMAAPRAARPAPKPVSAPEPEYSQMELTYTPVAMRGNNKLPINEPETVTPAANNTSRRF